MTDSRHVVALSGGKDRIAELEEVLHSIVHAYVRHQRAPVVNELQGALRRAQLLLEKGEES